MRHPFLKDAKGGIFILDPRMDVRSVARDVLKDLGFSEIILLESPNQLDPYLKDVTNPPRWVISGMSFDGDQSILNTLAERLEKPHLIGICFSLLITEEEEKYIPHAFEMGAFSWHRKPFTAVQLKQSLNELIGKAFSEEDLPLVSAHYLREYLLASEKYEDAFRLEKKLILKYPENYDLYIKLAEAYYSAGDFINARKELLSARFLGGNMTKCADQLLDLIRSENGEDQGSPATLGEILGFKTAIIVDSDSVAAKDMEKALLELGFTEISIFYDGQEAWDHLSKKDSKNLVDLILQEWRLPKLSGLAFMQRVHAKGWQSIPMVVVSSLPKQDDYIILKEMGVSNIIPKPFEKSMLVGYLLRILKEEKYPTNQRTIIRKIRIFLSEKKRDEAIELKDQLESMQELPKIILKEALAEIAYYDGDLEQAEKYTVEILRENSDSLPVLNLLSKVFFKKKDFENAKKCLSRAQSLSSQNVERLCSLAEISLILGDEKEAEANVAAASNLDSGNEKVQETEAKIAITQKDLGKARDLALKMDSVDGIAAYLNNRGVTLVQENKFAEAIGLYQSALEALPENQFALLNTVRYNLALAYARQQNTTQALASLSKIKENPSPEKKEFHGKVKDFKKRLEAASQAGVPLRIAAIKTGGGGASHALKPLHYFDPSQPPVCLFARPGEIFLHRIFKTSSSWEGVFKGRKKTNLP